MNKLEDKEGIARRIRQALLDAQKTQADLSRFCKVTSAAVARWCSAGTITEKNLERAADFLGVSEQWLRTGTAAVEVHLDEDPVPEGFSAIPAYQLHLGANNNADAEPEWEELHDVTPVLLPDTVFQKHGVRPARCRQAIVCGNSMEPFLMDGDRVVFYAYCDPRPGVNPIVDGKIYVIAVDGACRVKRLYKVRGGFQVVSDNPASPAETYVGEDCDHLRIYGRVIYVSRDNI